MLKASGFFENILLYLPVILGIFPYSCSGGSFYEKKGKNQDPETETVTLKPRLSWAWRCFPLSESPRQAGRGNPGFSVETRATCTAVPKC